MVGHLFEGFDSLFGVLSTAKVNNLIKLFVDDILHILNTTCLQF